MCMVSVGMHARNMYDEVRGQLDGVSSLLPPLPEFQGLNLGGQTLPAEPSLQPAVVFPMLVYSL